MTASDGFVVRDGIAELEHELPRVVDLISRTARWVHPETFRAFPVWYPETARGMPIYDSAWTRVYTNTSRANGKIVDKEEPNIKAGKSLVSALGVTKVPNWTVCHIWGIDDPKFARTNTVIRDPRYYSCVANMVWLPTPLKGFTDCVPLVKDMLRACAFHLYGWACEHPDVAAESSKIRSGVVPQGYPLCWPTSTRPVLPPGTAPFTTQVAQAIRKRKNELRRLLSSSEAPKFPRAQVQSVLSFWNIEL